MLSRIVVALVLTLGLLGVSMGASAAPADTAATSVAAQTTVLTASSMVLDKKYRASKCTNTRKQFRTKVLIAKLYYNEARTRGVALQVCEVLRKLDSGWVKHTAVKARGVNKASRKMFKNLKVQFQVRDIFGLAASTSKMIVQEGKAWYKIPNGTRAWMYCPAGMNCLLDTAASGDPKGSRGRRYWDLAMRMPLAPRVLA